MKKVVYIITVVVLVLLIGQGAYANGPAPRDSVLEVLIQDYTVVENLYVMGINDNEEKEIERWNNSDLAYDEERTKIEGQRILEFDSEGYDQFYIIIELKNGKKIVSNKCIPTASGSYIYNKELSQINEGIIKNRIENTKYMLSYLSVLIGCLIVTLAIESITGHLFGIKPLRYIVGINCCTNFLMNITLLYLLNNTLIKYWLIVLVLEMVVLAAEYLFYIIMYHQYSKKKIFAYTVIANALSYGVYTLISVYG